MTKLPMCRICMVKNVRMRVVNNKNIHELYEKLTGMPFVTEDKRPRLTCFFCFAKLKQCCQLWRKCVYAEELFAQMMNEKHELNPLIKQGHLGFLSRYVKTPVENISIIDGEPTGSNGIKAELPAVSEPQEQHQSHDIKLENLDSAEPDVEDIPPHQSETDLKDDIPLMDIIIEVEKPELVSKRKRRARDTGNIKLENLDSADSDAKGIPPHQSETDSKEDITLVDIKIEVEEEKVVFKREQCIIKTENIKQENLDSADSDEEGIPPHQWETDSKDDIPLMDIKIEVDDPELVSKRKDTEYESGAPGPSTKRKLRKENVHKMYVTTYSSQDFKPSETQSADNESRSSESTKTSTSEVQTTKSRKKSNAQKCREYRERKKLQNKMLQNITAERSDECSEAGQLPVKRPKTNAERRKKHYEAQKLKKQQNKKIPKTAKQRNKEYYQRKKLKIQALNTLNHQSDAAKKILLKQQSNQDLDAVVSTSSSQLNLNRRGNSQSQQQIETSTYARIS